MILSLENTHYNQPRVPPRRRGSVGQIGSLVVLLLFVHCLIAHTRRLLSPYSAFHSVVVAAVQSDTHRYASNRSSSGCRGWLVFLWSTELERETGRTCRGVQPAEDRAGARPGKQSKQSWARPPVVLFSSFFSFNPPWPGHSAPTYPIITVRGPTPRLPDSPTPRHNI